MKGATPIVVYYKHVEMEDGFEVVTKGHKLCSKAAPFRHTNNSAKPHNRSSSKPCDDVYEKLVLLKNQNFCLKYSSDLKSILVSTGLCIQKVVCYGIGRVSEDSTAQHQLGVLLALIEKLQVKHVLAYDPVLSDEEIEALRRLGIGNIGSNELCRHTARVPTLFFMVHCGKAMYNNLLYANWSLKHIPNVAIIGNCFSSYYLRLTERQLKDEAYYLLKIRGGYYEAPLPRFTIPNVFNDTAVHLFTWDKLQLLGDRVWNETPEPVLDPNDEEMRIDN